MSKFSLKLIAEEIKTSSGSLGPETTHFLRHVCNSEGIPDIPSTLQNMFRFYKREDLENTLDYLVREGWLTHTYFNRLDTGYCTTDQFKSLANN